MVLIGGEGTLRRGTGDEDGLLVYEKVKVFDDLRVVRMHPYHGFSPRNFIRHTFVECSSPTNTNRGEEGEEKKEGRVKGRG